MPWRPITFFTVVQTFSFTQVSTLSPKVWANGAGWTPRRSSTISGIGECVNTSPGTNERSGHVLTLTSPSEIWCYNPWCGHAYNPKRNICPLGRIVRVEIGVDGIFPSAEVEVTRAHSGKKNQKDQMASKQLQLVTSAQLTSFVYWKLITPKMFSGQWKQGRQCDGQLGFSN